MKEQEEFFSKDQNRLLNIATWAKYIAWIVLVIYGLSAGGKFISARNFYESVSSSTGSFISYAEKLAEDPLYTASLVVEMADTFLKGIVYFIVLNGISLGLNMIVETNINYRELRDREVGNE